MKKPSIFILLLSLFYSGFVLAKNRVNFMNTQKVVGDYFIESIAPLLTGGFRIQFQSSKKTDIFTRLILESLHSHPAIKLGAKFRLTARVVKETKKTARVRQMVIYLPSPGRKSVTPVWFLSQENQFFQELKDISLLKMHAWQSDYFVF